MKTRYVPFEGEALNGTGLAWGVRDENGVLYECMFKETTARRLAELSTAHPEEDFETVRQVLLSEGYSLADPASSPDIGAGLLAMVAQAIYECTETVKVCAPATDFYARRGDYTTEEMEVINPRKLVERLEALAREAGGSGN